LKGRKEKLLLEKKKNPECFPSVFFGNALNFFPRVFELPLLRNIEITHVLTFLARWRRCTSGCRSKKNLPPLVVLKGPPKTTKKKEGPKKQSSQKTTDRLPFFVVLGWLGARPQPCGTRAP
jgi:hypothetical protein